MHKVCFIPARSQSKRLLNKNILNLGELPLVCWTIIFAIKSNYFNEIIFSTDSEEYVAKVKRTLKNHKINDNLITYQIRNKDFCNDKTKIFDYLKFGFSHSVLDDKGGTIVQMLPTSPFRNYEDFSEAIELFDTSKKNIFSCVKYDFHIKFAFTMDNKRYKPLFDDSPMITGDTRSQSQKTYYHPTGTFYILDYDKLKKDMKTIYTDSIGFEVCKASSIDIDEREDFDFAQSFADQEIIKLMKL